MRIKESKRLEHIKKGQRKVILIDDEKGILDSISVFLERAGFSVEGYDNPVDGIEAIKNSYYDVLVLDFLMLPMHGDTVVEKIREFNNELYIILLTGHQDLAPPLETIKRLDIQGYCEKTDKFDQLLLLVESAIKSLEQKETIQDINEELRDQQEKLKQAYLDTIEVLRHTVEVKDIYTVGHSERVSKYSVLIGREMGLSEDELKTLEVGGLFHDVGKIGIPDGILTKAAKLSDEEYSEIKNHPAIGVHILSGAEVFKEMMPVVFYHHERWDGKGYPKQLKGEAIPKLARIAAVADAFDAMTSSRAYRKALDLSIAKAEIEKNLGIQFDPEAGQAMLNLLENNEQEILRVHATKSTDREVEEARAMADIERDSMLSSDNEERAIDESSEGEI